MMKDYKPLGDYIREVNVRNKDLNITEPKGININKYFMPSVANIIGTDLSNYKLVSKNQFACNLMHVGRDEKIPMAMHTDDSFIIVSPAYFVFEIAKTDSLLPEYLMMWFRRSEFDRNAWFYTDADVRGGLPKEALLNMLLPVPPIEKQREIVAEYETLSNRISINQQIIQKLEATAQALYRKMFVDGIDKENLPEGWRMGRISDLVEIIDGDRGVNYPKDTDLYPAEFCLFLNAGNVTSEGFNFENKLYITEKKSDSMRAGKLKRNDIVFTTRGTVGNFALYSNDIPFEHMRINSGMVILRSEIIDTIQYIYHLFHLASFKQEIINYLSGSAQPQLPIKDFNRIPIVIPSNEKIKIFSNNSVIINKNIDLLKNENEKLTELQSLLLAKMGR